MNDVSVKLFAEAITFPSVTERTGRGLHFLCNGWTLSAQAGWGHYCSSDPSRNEGLTLTNDTIRPDCEIALWPIDGGMIELSEDMVMGWISWSAVIEIVYWLVHLDHVPDEKEICAAVLRLTHHDSKT